MINLMEQEFFAARDPQIAAASGAARKRLIAALPQTNPTLNAEFLQACHDADCLSKFLRQSNRYPLTAVGRINTYAVFADTIRHLINPNGRAGVMLPTGIAISDTCKLFFAHIAGKQHIASLISVHEIRAFFISTDSREPFCLLTLSGRACETPQFAFSLTSVEQIRDARRLFTLSSDDLARLNPNTHTCPVFRTKTDAELTRRIYERVPVLDREGVSDGSPWGVRFMQGLFNMTSDSQLFHEAPGKGLLPLYEAKLLHQFDHRFATFDENGESRDATEADKAQPSFCVRPRYWVEENEVLNRLAPPTEDEQEASAEGKLQPAELIKQQRNRSPKWLFAFRSIGRPTDARTMIFSLLPLSGLGNSSPVMLLSVTETPLHLCLLGNLNAMIFDFVARTKIGGANLNFFLVQQLPVLPPSFYRAADVAYVASRVLELVYTADDMQPLADALRAAASPLAASVPRAPYRWDEARRALLRAELDAWYARAYGLTRDELRYILDPADVHGPDFPGETFRVLKEKETAKFGEYRTRRLVLEAWDKLADGR
jgi:hypothetical protein